MTKKTDNIIKILNKVTEEKGVTWEYDAKTKLYITQQSLKNPEAAVSAYNKYLSSGEKDKILIALESGKVATKNFSGAMLLKYQDIPSIIKTILMESFTSNEKDKAKNTGNKTPVEALEHGLGGNKIKFTEYEENSYISSPVFEPKSGIRIINSEIGEGRKIAAVKDNCVVITPEERDLEKIGNASKYLQHKLSKGLKQPRKETSMEI